jgi:hypothetical protein
MSRCAISSLLLLGLLPRGVSGATCDEFKQHYRDEQCCGNGEKSLCVSPTFDASAIITKLDDIASKVDAATHGSTPIIEETSMSAPPDALPPSAPLDASPPLPLSLTVPTRFDQLTCPHANGAAMDLSCQGGCGTGTDAPKTHPPSTKVAADFVAQGGPAVAICEGYSDTGYPPCSGMCSSYQGAVDVITAKCAGMNEVGIGNPMPASGPGQSSFQSTFQQWYENKNTTCVRAATFVVAFSRMLNLEFVASFKKLEVESGWFENTFLDDASKDATGLYPLETSSVGPYDTAMAYVADFVGTMLTDAGDVSAVGTAILTYSQHTKIVKAQAKCTSSFAAPPLGPLKMVDYGQITLSPNYGKPSTCGVWPEHADHCLATRNAFAFAYHVYPICDASVKQIPWTCTSSGQNHFKAASILLDLEEQIKALASSNDVSGLTNVCQTTASVDAITSLWADASVDLVFANREFSCLIDSTRLPCGPLPQMSEREYNVLMAYWLRYGVVHYSVIVNNCKPYVPAFDNFSLPDPSTFFSAVLTMDQMAAKADQYQTDYLSGDFPASGTLADCGALQIGSRRSPFVRIGSSWINKNTIRYLSKL